jgi:Rod binding domain-containing protein
MNVADIADLAYRYREIKPPSAKTQVHRDAGVAGTGARVAPRTAIDKKSELFEQCREFESIFVKMMLKEMRATVDKSGGLVSGGWAEDIFQDMLDDEYSKSMAETANFGLADQLYRQLALA